MIFETCIQYFLITVSHQFPLLSPRSDRPKLKIDPVNHRHTRTRSMNRRDTELQE